MINAFLQDSDVHSEHENMINAVISELDNNGTTRTRNAGQEENDKFLQLTHSKVNGVQIIMIKRVQ